MTPDKSWKPDSSARSSRSSKSMRARRASDRQEGDFSYRSAEYGVSHNASPSMPTSRPPYDSQSAPSRYNSAVSDSGAGHSNRAAALAASQYARSNPSYSMKGRGASKRKPLVIALVVVLLIAIIGCGTAFGLYASSVSKELNRGDKSEEELKAIGDVLGSAPTDLKKPFYMMLIGSDRRAADEDMGARSDTNIVARVDATNGTITMVSIPRDTRVYLDAVGGYTKFNAAYSYNGAAGAIAAAEDLLGIEISHYAEVNFEGLVDMVNAVGGVDVEVEERIDDSDADTPGPNAPHLVIEEGLQHLDGNGALVFARSRAYADGDFTRTSNQRKLIQALAEKVLDQPLTEMPAIIKHAASCTTTDLTVGDILALAQLFREFDEMTIYSALLPSTTDGIMEGGMMVSYVINDAAATKEMMRIIDEGGDPSILSETYVGVDTTGTDDGVYYSDQGMVSDPQGQYYYQEYQEEIYY